MGAGIEGDCVQRSRHDRCLVAHCNTDGLRGGQAAIACRHRHRRCPFRHWGNCDDSTRHTYRCLRRIRRYGGITQRIVIWVCKRAGYVHVSSTAIGGQRDSGNCPHCHRRAVGYRYIDGSLGGPPLPSLAVTVTVAVPFVSAVILTVPPDTPTIATPGADDMAV